MKLEAMKHKTGRRTKEEKAALEASGKKPMRADEELAQQTGESRANIQKIVRLNKLDPKLQQMVEEKKLPVHRRVHFFIVQSSRHVFEHGVSLKKGGCQPPEPSTHAGFRPLM